MIIGSVPRTAREVELYKSSLSAIYAMRDTKGLSLTKAARQSVTTPETVLKYARPALRKSHKRWKVTRSDPLIRPIAFYDQQGRTTVLVDFKTASQLGEYHNAVHSYLMGDPYPLRSFEGRTFRDASGRTHEFITDPKTLRRFGDAGEVRFETIYQFVGV